MAWASALKRQKKKPEKKRNKKRKKKQEKEKEARKGKRSKKGKKKQEKDKEARKGKRSKKRKKKQEKRKKPRTRWRRASAGSRGRQHEAGGAPPVTDFSGFFFVYKHPTPPHPSKQGSIKSKYILPAYFGGVGWDVLCDFCEKKGGEKKLRCGLVLEQDCAVTGVLQNVFLLVSLRGFH